jgi:hypothetical protein
VVSSSPSGACRAARPPPSEIPCERRPVAGHQHDRVARVVGGGLQRHVARIVDGGRDRVQRERRRLADLDGRALLARDARVGVLHHRRHTGAAVVGAVSGGVRVSDRVGLRRERRERHLGAQRLLDVRDHDRLVDAVSGQREGEAPLVLDVAQPRPAPLDVLRGVVLAVEQDRPAGERSLARDQVVGVVGRVVREVLPLLELRERRDDLTGLGEEHVDALGRHAIDGCSRSLHQKLVGAAPAQCSCS